MDGEGGEGGRSSLHSEGGCEKSFLLVVNLGKMRSKRKEANPQIRRLKAFRDLGQKGGEGGSIRGIRRRGEILRKAYYCWACREGVIFSFAGRGGFEKK